MSKDMTKELESWLDDWSSKLDEVDESDGKVVFSMDLVEKFSSFLLKISSFPHRHLEDSEGDDE